MDIRYNEHIPDILWLWSVAERLQQEQGIKCGSGHDRLRPGTESFCEAVCCEMQL